MKMTSWGCCVLVYIRSGEPVVHGDQPGLPRTDVSGSEFEVGAPTSEEEEAERKKSQTKRPPKSPLTAVLDSWLLSILHCRFLSFQWLIPCFFLGDAETIPGVSGKEGVSTGVETDGQLRRRHIVVIRSLVPLAGRSQHDLPEAVHSLGRSRELLEWAFDDGNSCAQMRNLLILFQVGSKFLPYFFLQISSWPIPLPLWFVPLVIRWCLCVAPFARRRKLSCCLPWWVVSIFRLV